MKKIIYTIAGTYRSAGMERVLADKANYLVSHGYEVDIVTTDQKGREPAFDLDPRIKTFDLGVNYEANNGGSFLSKLTLYPLKKMRHRKRLKALIAREKPDICVSMFCGDEGFLPKFRDGSKKVLEVHFSRFKRLQYDRSGLWAMADKLRSRMDVRRVKAFDRFVVLTNEDYGYWGRPKNGVVIPNSLSSLPSETSKLDSKTVLFVGRFSYQKAPDRLIEVWRRISYLPEGMDWKLRMVGDGEVTELLKKRAEGLNIEFLEPQKDMKKVYLDASVLVLTSRYEGLPMVLLEAQAFGIPAVSFACKCGPADVISDGKSGFLVPEGNINSFATALAKFIENEDLMRSFGAEARKESARWDRETIMTQWINLFESL